MKGSTCRARAGRIGARAGPGCVRMRRRPKMVRPARRRLDGCESPTNLLGARRDRGPGVDAVHGLDAWVGSRAFRRLRVDGVATKSRHGGVATAESPRFADCESAESPRNLLLVGEAESGAGRLKGRFDGRASCDSRRRTASRADLRSRPAR